MTTAPFPSTPLADRYVVERELGAGGMATVYLAHDRKHGARVAVKVLHRELASHVSNDRFQREIQITAQLQHPHILPVLDSGTADGLPFYTMPFVDGETLAARVERERQLPVADAVRIARQVADALGYAHARGFVHRDIKPSNILLAGYPPKPGLTTEWYALLADFGIARAVDTNVGERLTDSGLAVGTALYMSPEQATGDRVDGRSDVYALGCVLYEMLAGSPPFSGATPQSVLARHAVDPPPSLRTVRRTVSPALEEAVARALAKVPADRFTDATAFRDALGGAGMEQSVTMGVTSARPARRRWLLAAAAGVAVVAGAVTWRALGTAASPLDDGRVMVFPLVVSPGAGRPGTGQPVVSGEDVATLVGNALDGVGPLRWIDGWHEMNAAQRRAPDALLASDARALAARQRCAYYVLGKVTPLGGDSVSVALDLFRTRDDEPVRRGSASAPRADAFRAGLSAANDLLPSLIPGGGPAATAEWTNRPPAAVAQFLLGEAAFRRLHPVEALSHYREAVARDSTFALAALRGAQAATWRHELEAPAEAASLVQTALRQRLPERYRHFALGDAAFLAGRADAAVAELRQAIALDPEMMVAWIQLGEVYTHLLPVSGDVDSLAADAFERARRLDTSATDLLLHPIELAVRRGRLDVAEPLAQRLLAGQPDSAQAEEVQLLMACARRGAGAVDWIGRVATQPFTLLQVGRQAGVERSGGCAESAFGALVRAYPPTARNAAAFRWYAVTGLQDELLARGDVGAASAALDAAIATGDGGESLYLLDATLLPQMAARARAIAAEDARRYGADYAGSPSTLRLWHLALWEAHDGRAEVAAAIARELARRAAAEGDSVVALRARSAAAHAALAKARTRADSTAAMALLSARLAEPMTLDDLSWDVGNERGSERLLLARALMARGDYAGAIGIADVFDSVAPLIHALYLPASLELRLSAADALRDRPRVSRYQARLAALRGGHPAAAR